MKNEEDNMTSTIRQPSAFLPVAMSLVALALVLGHVALFGVVHEADEGTAAHLWQILMAAQLPIVAFFALKYVPQKPKQALLILALQIVAALTACAPVFFLKL
jgi:FtsH-binding integral membrane protein